MHLTIRSEITEIDPSQASYYAAEAVADLYVAIALAGLLFYDTCEFLFGVPSFLFLITIVLCFDREVGNTDH